MPEKKLKIPEFHSLEEFRVWWESPEAVQFKEAHPDLVDSLLNHRLIKSWADQVGLERLNLIPSALHQPVTLPPSNETKTFGRYQIEKELGKGGMGVVYLVYDPVLQRKVALKIILTEDQESQDRFLREARAIAHLKHPNIVQLYDVGEIDHQHYFTMDYIEGGSLDDLKGNLPIRSIAEIIRDIALALHYAHTKNIIHRDIKPANILIDADNKPYLTDFGLAKELSGLDRSLTLSGTIMGTPDYMSPEQAKGEKHQIDYRSDVFSLGATLYHIMTGQPPFKGQELYEVLSKVVNDDPPSPKSIADVIPRDMEAICLTCLEKDKKNRYPTSKALAIDLTRFLEGQSVLAQRKGLISKLVEKMSKNKIATLAIFSTVILLMIVPSVLMFSTTRVGMIRQEAEQVKIEAIKKQEKERKRVRAKVAREREARKRIEAANYTNRAIILSNQGDFSRAIANFNKALELNPELVEAYLGRGVARDKQDDLDGALADYDQVIALNENFPVVYFNRALVYKKKGDLKEAIINGEKFLELAPHDSRAPKMRKAIKRWSRIKQR